MKVAATLALRKLSGALPPGGSRSQLEVHVVR